MAENEFRPASETINWDEVTDDYGRITDPDLRLWFGSPLRQMIPIHHMKNHVLIREMDNRDGFTVPKDKLYTRITQIPELLSLVPDCVPDGWWVWDLGEPCRWDLGESCRWYCSPNKPEYSTTHGWDFSDEDEDTYVYIDPVFAPDLYAWKGPIEQACVRVEREKPDEIEQDELKKSQNEYRAGNWIDSKEWLKEMDSEGWIPNTGSCPLGDDELVYVILLGGLDSVEKVGNCDWRQDKDSGSITHWKPAGEGWVLHDGKGLPFDYGDRPKVDAITRDGHLCGTEPGQVVGSWRHSSDEMQYDIIWYRPIPDKPEPEKQREPRMHWIQLDKSGKLIDCYYGEKLPKYAHRIKEHGEIYEVREVIHPVIKELPDCDGLWAKKTESDYLVYGVKVKDVPAKHRKGQYIHIDPIIKQAFKDAEE